MKISQSINNRTAFSGILAYCLLFFATMVSSQNMGGLQAPQSSTSTPPTILLDSLTIFEDESLILDLNDPAIIRDENTPPGLIKWDR